MLEAMRRNSRNAVIYVLFGVIIAVFVINFGPGSRGCSGGPGIASYAAKVNGSTLSEQDFRFAFIALGGGEMGGGAARERRIKEFVLDKLIERELLAQEAERMGFQVSAKEAEDMIADGRMILMGVPRRVDGYVFKDGKFDYERFRMVAQNRLGVSVVRFVEIQRREMLAEKMRELLRVGAKVAEAEVKTDFEMKGLQVNLEYVRYSPRKFEDDLEPTAAEIDAYVKGHGDELKKQYGERAFLYKQVEKQARLRHVLVGLEKDAAPAKVAAAQKQIEQAAAKAKAGTAFADVARATSTDERTKARGGLLGWRRKGFSGMGDAIDGKIFAAGVKKGDLIGPERVERGFELILVEDFREGDVPLEVAQRELAEEQVIAEKAKAKARAEAEALLAQLKAGKKLEDLVPKAGAEADVHDDELAKARQANEPPKLSETGMFSRRGEMIPEVGVSKELARRAFELKPGEVAGPFDVPGGVVVVRLKERKDPDLTDFDRRKAELTREFERSKWAEVLDSWSKDRCVEARDAGRLNVNDEVLSYDAPGSPGVAKAGTKYTPCSGAELF